MIPADCNKKGYRSRGDAKKYLKTANHHNRFSKQVTDVYYCISCNRFHVTTQPKIKSRKRTFAINKQINN